VSDYLVNVPENKIDMTVQYILPYTRTKIDLVQLLRGKTYSQLPTAQNPDMLKEVTAGFYTFDLKFTQPLTEYFEAYLALENLWDRNYETVYGFPQRGRTVLFGMNARY
jgi:outer membrane cobalamin receptor